MKKISKPLGKLLTLLVCLICGVWLERLGVIAYFADPWEQEYVIDLLIQHLYLVGVSMFFAIVVGVSIGVLLTRSQFQRFQGIVMYIVGLGQTVPPLAMLALTMGFLGIGSTPAIFALFALSLLPIARNTLAGILEVPPSLLNAANGIGMPAWRILWEVELPNAMLVILTGIRIALVINIGAAALGFLIGAGGLGDLIFTGIQLFEPQKLLAGAIPTILLALFGDYFMEWCILLFVSRGLRISS